MTAPSYNQSEPAFQSENVYGYMVPSYDKSEPAFQPGVIITKDGDTLGGLIKYANPLPSDKVIYKPNLIASDSIFSVDKIKSIITQYVYLANIPFEGKEKMMHWLAVRKINLYVHAKYYNNSFNNYPYPFPFNIEGPPEITYVLEKDRNQFVYINQKDFKVMMSHIFFDTPDMLKKIGKKGSRFDDMIKIERV